MLNYSLYIVEDGGVFYFDLEEYNLNSDILIEHGDIIKFIHDFGYRNTTLCIT